MNLRTGLALALTVMATFAACVGDDPSAGPLSDGGTTSSSGGLDGSTSGGASDGATPVPGVVVDDRYTAGTRLEPTWLALPDGSQRFAGWYDTKLRITCTYRVQANGRYACVPDAEDAIDSAGIYADSTCTMPQAGVVDVSCSRIPPFVRLTGGARCFDDVYASGASLSNPYVLVGACEPAFDRGKAFVLGAKLASSDFVQGDVEEWADAPPTTGARPIRAQFMRGEDGSLGFHRWVLETGKTECTFSKQSYDDTVRCYPVAPATVNGFTFADPTCSTRFAEVGNQRTECTGETTQIAALGQRTSDSCSYQLTGTDWFTVGPSPATSFYQKNAGGQCEAYPVTFPRTRIVGTQLPVETFGAPPVEAPAPGATFSSIHVQLPDGTRGRHGYYDGTRNVRCTMERAADLSIRCIPESSSFARYVYTDAACTESKLVARVVSAERDLSEHCDGDPRCADAGLTCAAPAKPTFVRLTNYTACSYDRTTRAFTTGEALVQYYERDRDNTCVNHVVGTGEGVYDISEIPPAELLGAVPSHP